MSLWIDTKYTNMLTPYVRNFKRKSDVLWNFSCPFCGDSPKNPHKARGYVFRKATGLFYKCHKCGHGASIGNLVKHVNQHLYDQYAMEKYKDRIDRSGVDVSSTPTTVVSQPPVVDAVLDGIKTLADLQPDHPAVKYIASRRIPIEFYDKLYFAPKFMKFVNSIVPDKFQEITNDHPRLIIPYLDRHGRCYALQGRAFGNEQPKYQTIKIDQDAERIYGLDRINYSKRVYVVEGPIDSMFLPNAIAVSGSSFNGATIEQLKANCTLVYDNERRSPQLAKLIEKSIDSGFSVCLWPDTIKYKDINEMVVDGQMTPTEILAVIDANTYSGIQAQLRFASWRQCDEVVPPRPVNSRRGLGSKLTELLGAY